jgi:hypothetical protein
MIRKTFLLLLLSLVLCSNSFQTKIDWKELETGLSYASVPLELKSIVGDSKVDILKIDPKYFKFEILSAGEKKSDSKKADQWCKENNLLAVINAGMFKLEGDYKMCTGYMKNYGYINNPTLNSSYKTIVAFNAKDTSVPSAQIIDLSCQNWEVLKNKYNSFSQGIRMIDCQQKNKWQLDQKRWSMVVIGEDKKGNLLFIFVRSPYRVHDFVGQLLALPINLKRLMYLEGGPEASFYLQHPFLKVERCGSYETGFNENDANKDFWDIPNLIGIKRKNK